MLRGMYAETEELRLEDCGLLEGPAEGWGRTLSVLSSAWFSIGRPTS